MADYDFIYQPLSSGKLISTPPTEDMRQKALRVLRKRIQDKTELAERVSMLGLDDVIAT